MYMSQVLTFIVVFHFVLSIATDVLLGFYAGLQVMLFVCQVYFILWGLFLFFGYAHIFRKIYAHAVKRQKSLYDQHRTAPGPCLNSQKSTKNASRGNQASGKSRYTLSTAIKVTFFTSICGLMTVALEVYAIVGVYKTFTPLDQPKPWPWYLYHTVMRLIEALMCVAMSYVASQPIRYKSRNSSENRKSDGCCSCSSFSAICAPCAEIVCCGRSINRSGNGADWNEHEFQARSFSKMASFKNGTRDSYNTGSTRHIYMDDMTDCTPIVDLQPSPVMRSSPLSRRAEENSYVRFSPSDRKTQNVGKAPPYNEIFPGEDSQIHNVSTFRLRGDGFVNTAYTGTADYLKNPPNKNVDSLKHFRNDSDSSNDFFKAPSSVSLANSMENELEKVFESFKLDSSCDNDSDVKSIDLDLIIASNLPNMKETDLISVDSIPDTKEEFTMPSEIIASSDSKGQNGIDLEDMPVVLEEQLRDEVPSSRVQPAIKRARSYEHDNQNGDTSDLERDQTFSRSYSDRSKSYVLPENQQDDNKYSRLLDIETKEDASGNLQFVERQQDGSLPQGQDPSAMLVNLLTPNTKDEINV